MWIELRRSLDLHGAFNSPPTIVLQLSLLSLLVPTPASSAYESMLGVVVAPEHRCSPYDRQDYTFPNSVKLQTVESLGGIFSPYTGLYYKNIREVDLDHIVALTEAHDSGLCAADADTKRSFSVDILNLTLAPPSLNRSQKMGHDASVWIPENNQCWFAQRVLDVKGKYGLTIDRAEANVLSRVLQDCGTTALQFLTSTPPIASADKSQRQPAPKSPERLSQLVDTEPNGFGKYLTRTTLAFFVSSLGAIVIVFGLIRGILSNRIVLFRVTLPGGVVVQTNAEGLAILAVGAVLIIYSMQFFDRGEKYTSMAVGQSYFSLPFAYAQSELSHEGIESQVDEMDPPSGWVYLGPSHDEKKWNFELKSIDPFSGIVLESKLETPLWDRKFDAFTGTLFEGIIGVGRPERIGVVQKGACVRLESTQGFDEVALVELWMKVEKTQCD